MNPERYALTFNLAADSAIEQQPMAKILIHRPGHPSLDMDKPQAAMIEFGTAGHALALAQMALKCAAELDPALGHALDQLKEISGELADLGLWDDGFFDYDGKGHPRLWAKGGHGSIDLGEVDSELGNAIEYICKNRDKIVETIDKVVP